DGDGLISRISAFRAQRAQSAKGKLAHLRNRRRGAQVELELELYFESFFHFTGAGGVETDQVLAVGYQQCVQIGKQRHVGDTVVCFVIGPDRRSRGLVQRNHSQRFLQAVFSLAKIIESPAQASIEHIVASLHLSDGAAEVL